MCGGSGKGWWSPPSLAVQGVWRGGGQTFLACLARGMPRLRKASGRPISRASGRSHLLVSSPSPRSRKGTAVATCTTPTNVSHTPGAQRYDLISHGLPHPPRGAALRWGSPWPDQGRRGLHAPFALACFSFSGGKHHTPNTPGRGQGNRKDRIDRRHVYRPEGTSRGGGQPPGGPCSCGPRGHKAWTLVPGRTPQPRSCPPRARPPWQHPRRRRSCRGWRPPELRVDQHARQGGDATRVTC